MHALAPTLLDDLVKQGILKRKYALDLKFAPAEISNWHERDFLAVTDRHCSKGVIIAELDTLFKVPFSLQSRRPSSMTGRTEAIICDFCSTWQRGSNSAVITFDLGSKSSRSYLCCADLMCSLHVRDLTTQAALSRTQLREQVTPIRRIERLRENLHSILMALS